MQKMRKMQQVQRMQQLMIAMKNKTLTELYDMLAEVTKELFDRTADSDFILHLEVMDIVVDHYHHSGRPKAEARQATCYLLKKRGLSYRRIARLVGYKDHTQALNAVKVLQGRLDVEDGFAEWFAPLEEENLLLKLRE